MTADPERGHRSIRLSRAHIFALPARLHTLRHFANSLSHKGSASFYFLSLPSISRFWKACFFGKRRLRASETVQSIIYTITQSRESTRNDQRDCKIVSHGKSCIIMFLSRYLHVRAHTLRFFKLFIRLLPSLQFNALTESCRGNSGIDVISSVTRHCKDLYPRFYRWTI